MFVCAQVRVTDAVELLANIARSFFCARWIVVLCHEYGSSSGGASYCFTTVRTAT